MKTMVDSDGKVWQVKHSKAQRGGTTLVTLEEVPPKPMECKCLSCFARSNAEQREAKELFDNFWKEEDLHYGGSQEQEKWRRLVRYVRKNYGSKVEIVHCPEVVHTKRRIQESVLKHFAEACHDLEHKRNPDCAQAWEDHINQEVWCAKVLKAFDAEVVPKAKISNVPFSLVWQLGYDAAEINRDKSFNEVLRALQSKTHALTESAAATKKWKILAKALQKKLGDGEFYDG